MTQYREILRLTALGLKQREIIESIGVAQKTIVKVQRQAREMRLQWPLDDSMTDEVLEQMLFPKEPKTNSQKRMPDFDYIRKELMRNGVNKKLLWTEYLEECRMAGDPAYIVDPDTGEVTKVFLFVGVMSYSQYPYVEGFINEQQNAWITAHIHMYEYFGGVAKLLVPDNCKTAVIRNGDWNDLQINRVYHEMAEHYGCAIVPAKVRAPKDKPNAEGTVHCVTQLKEHQGYSCCRERQAGSRV